MAERADVDAVGAGHAWPGRTVDLPITSRNAFVQQVPARPVLAAQVSGSSIQCAPDLPRYGRGNDQGNDQPATTGLPDRGYVPIRSENRGSPRIHRQTADR